MLCSGTPFQKKPFYVFEIAVSLETDIRNVKEKKKHEPISGKMERHFFSRVILTERRQGFHNGRMQPSSQLMGRVMDLLLTGTGG